MQSRKASISTPTSDSETVGERAQFLSRSADSDGDGSWQRSAALGWCIWAIGYALIVAGVWLVWIVKGAIPGGIGGLLIACGAGCVVRGKKLKAVGASEVLRRDSRPPILYLRSFDDDGTGMKIPNEAVSKTFEERLAQALGKLGPVVAIGKPGENLPELGAARMYVDDDSWQSTVKSLIGRAQFVIFRAGETEGLRWEVQTATRSLDPEKLILFFGYEFDRNRQRLYARFRERVMDYFPRPLPEEIGDAFFLYFDSEWNARFYDFYRPARRGAKYPGREPFVAADKLRTVLRRLHQACSMLKPPKTWERIAALTALGLFALFSLFIIYLASKS